MLKNNKKVTILKKFPRTIELIIRNSLVVSVSIYKDDINIEKIVIKDEFNSI